VDPDNRFYVSWISTAEEAGQVQVVGGASYDDTCSECTTGKYHYIRVDNLQSGSTYRYYITSGGRKYNNGGQNYSIQLGPPSTDFHDRIIGRVKNADGSDADIAIVYVTIQKADGSANSALLSQMMTPDDAGFFRIYLSEARTASGALFAYNKNADKLIITANGPDGYTTVTVVASVALPPQPIPPNVVLTLGSGAVSLATPTPTASRTVASPTSPPPTATPTLQPAVATSIAASKTAAAAPPPTRTRVRPSATPLPPPTDEPTAEPITLEPAQPTLVAIVGTETSEATPSATVLRVTPLTTPSPTTTSFLPAAIIGPLLVALGMLALFGALGLGILAFILSQR
jgi:hypothetical protein